MSRHLIFAGLGIAALFGSAALFAAPARQPPVRAIAELILSHLDQKCLGCGTDLLVEDKSIAHAMAFALLASAGANLSNQRICQTSAQWLLDNSSASEGATGWGLGFAWDAFGDGSKNPSNTVYGITTALAVRGLMDAYDMCGKDKAYVKTAESALDYYTRFFTKTENGGYFWYSDQVPDAIFTPNISAMLLGPLLRVGKAASRPDFLHLADLTASELMARRITKGGYDYWTYSDYAGGSNDAVHAAFIVLGLVEYRSTTNKNLALKDAIRLLSTYMRNGGVFDYSPADTDDKKRLALPARLWSVGMLAYAFETLGRHDLAEEAVSVLPQYKFGRFYKEVPNGKPRQDIRMIAYLLFGLSMMAKEHEMKQQTGSPS